jgi:hypothetical protein
MRVCDYACPSGEQIANIYLSAPNFTLLPQCIYYSREYLLIHMCDLYYWCETLYLTVRTSTLLPHLKSARTFLLLPRTFI